MLILVVLATKELTNVVSICEEIVASLCFYYLLSLYLHVFGL